MGRRLSTGADPYGPIADEMYEHEPPVPDDIKIDVTFLKQVLLVSEYVRVGGPRIAELLGAPRDGSDPPEWHHSVTADDQRELHELLRELMAGIEDHVDPDEDILDYAMEVGLEGSFSVEANEEVFLYVYRKCRTIDRLITFAIEHDVDLSIE